MLGPNLLHGNHQGASLESVGVELRITTDMVIVKHGANASFPRPVANGVYWQGSVDPLNKALGDFWLNTTAYD